MSSSYVSVPLCWLQCSYVMYERNMTDSFKTIVTFLLKYLTRHSIPSCKAYTSTVPELPLARSSFRPTAVFVANFKTTICFRTTNTSWIRRSTDRRCVRTTRSTTVPPSLSVSSKILTFLSVVVYQKR